MAVHTRRPDTGQVSPKLPRIHSWLTHELVYEQPNVGEQQHRVHDAAGEGPPLPAPPLCSLGLGLLELPVGEAVSASLVLSADEGLLNLGAAPVIVVVELDRFVFGVFLHRGRLCDRSAW